MRMAFQDNSILQIINKDVVSNSDPHGFDHSTRHKLGEELYQFIVGNTSIVQNHFFIRYENQPLLYDFNEHLNAFVDINPLCFEEGQSFVYRINHMLRDGGTFICCVHQDRIHLKNKRYSKGIVKSRAEVLGRLVNAGFSIIDFKVIFGKLYVCSMKTDAPKPEPKGNTGLIIPMERIGRKGEKVRIFKFRTMHPFSEYLQDYVVNLNGYNDKGKPRDDFRLTRWGQYLRKYWIDELPQLYNILRGDLALVGVRPLSEHRYKELPEDVRVERIKYKPGCIPPYVSLLMPDSEGNIEAERIYFSEKRSGFYWTDIKYFFLAIFNVFSGRIRSS